MNKLLLKNRFLVLLSAAVIILAVGGGLYYSQNKTILDNGQQSQSDNGNTTAETESPDPDSRSQAQTPKNPAPAPAAAPAASVNLDTPILQKSSGNNGPVPPGANIEFVCRTSTVIDCTILLTSTSTGRKIDLGQKKTQDNRQGQIGTTWIWPAEAGTWEVVARVSAAGQAKLSAPQKLEVR